MEATLRRQTLQFANPRKRLVTDASSRHAQLKKKYFDNLYLPQLIPALLLLLLSVITMWTAARVLTTPNFLMHLAGMALGAVGAWMFWRYDCRRLSNMVLILFVASCLFMIMPKIPGLGYEAKGMVGWVKLGFFRFQPSEPGKIFVIFLMASAAAQYNGKIERFRDYCKLCATLFVPLIMILPIDLGTGLIILVTGAVIIMCSGAKRSWIIATILLLVTVVALVVITSTLDGFYHILKPYQMKRLTNFLNPEGDVTESGYNLRQSKIAVGSGGLFGKGIGFGYQAQSGFLPEAHTDFIFGLYAEQFGFVGSVLLLLLFAWMIFATISLAMKTENLFMKFVLVGCVALWTFQVLQNVGMCMGIMPITGIPLPFLSYGSSSMISQIALIGIVQSAWRHRPRTA